MSRKIDALVAEHVFNKEIEWITILFNPELCFKDEVHVSDLIDTPVRVPHYSTDIATAWEVVNEFGRVVVTRQEMPERYYCEIIIHLGMGDFNEYRAEADTAPMAIALAALKVRGVEYE